MKKEALLNFLSSLLAIICGLLIGLIILLFTDAYNAFPGFGAILAGGFTDGSVGMGQTLYFATPIILTGLSVGFAYKTGLFNIGASGQFMAGAYTAILIGVKCSFLPPQIHWIVCLIAACAAGAIWGAVPGLLKAFRNVNEVISCIMMNYVGMYLVNWFIQLTVYNQAKNQSMPVAKAANLPTAGLDKLFNTRNINIGIFIALAAVVIIFILLEKTKFGFELKACGLNKNASRYAGINAGRNIVNAMIISGILSGLGGAISYLSGTGKFMRVVDELANEGFTGISVAFLGTLHPFGILLAGLFIAYITVGGQNMQLFNFSPEIINIIISVIIYCGAFSLLFKELIGRFVFRSFTARSTSANQDSDDNTALPDKGDTSK